MCVKVRAEFRSHVCVSERTNRLLELSSGLTGSTELESSLHNKLTLPVHNQQPERLAYMSTSKQHCRGYR